MNFEQDIFISYAHVDNEALIEGQIGWIDGLHRALRIRLTQLLGEEPKIWRDPRLRGSDIFDQVIVSQLAQTAVLVSVLSPRYIRSEWCRKELEGFLQAAEQSGGVHIDHKSRIFKVIKTHVPHEEHPPEIQGLLGYEFFQIDPQSGHFHEFNPVFGPKAERQYWARLEDLAQDIRQLLEMIKAHQIGAEPQTVAPSGTTVYLAETSFDLSQERDQIRRELEVRGHIVLPDRHLPLQGPGLERQVREDLGRCTLSIHLIGTSYGIIPDMTEHSAVELQNVLAAERSQHSQNSDFSRLIWLPVDLKIDKIEDARQREFVTALQNAPVMQAGADLLQTTLEELKTVIQDKLAPHKQAPRSPANGGPTRIYLICDQRDLDDVAPLEDYLFDQGFEVMEPLFEGDEAEVSVEHRESLRICDAVLIYYGHASEVWLRGKLRDLRKAPGYGRTTPIGATTIYVAGPQDSRKARLRTREVDVVIRSFNGFSPKVLAPFLASIELRNGGQS